jgi:hypothetical protein
MQMNSFPKMNFNSIFKYDTSSLGPASHGEQAWEWLAVRIAKFS